MPNKKIFKPSDAGQIDIMSRTLSRSIRTRSHQAMLNQCLGRNMPSLSTHTQSVNQQTTSTVPTSVRQLVVPSAYLPLSDRRPNFTRGPTPFCGLTSTPDSSIFGINPHISPFLSSTGSSNSNLFSNVSSATTSDGIQSFPSSPLKRPAPVPDSPAGDVNNNDIDDDEELPPRFEDDYGHGGENNKNVDDDNELPPRFEDEYKLSVVPSGTVHPAQATKSSHAPTPTTLTPALPDEERKFQCHFNLWQPECPAEPEPKKHKRTPGGSRQNLRKSTKPKYKNYAPKVPTYITYSPKTADFETVKSKLFDACNEHLPGVSQVLERAWVAGELAIMGFVAGSNGFKGQDKASIKNPTLFDNSFERFNIASLKASAGTKMGFRIVHENPLASENARRSLASALKESAIDEESEASEGEESVASDGSAILSPGERNLRTLMQRFEQDFKRGENVTSVPNPKNSGECLLLNTSRIRTWANDWADGVRGVDEVNPPMKRPGFRWIPVGDYEEEKNRLLGLTPARPSTASPTGTGGAVVHHNYYGHPGHLAVPFAAAPVHGAPMAAQLERLSPPPQDTVIDFDKFLDKAGIGLDMLTTRNILAKEGINDFLRLLDRGTYTIEAFHKMGIPFAQAEDIFKAVPKYNHYLKYL